MSHTPAQVDPRVRRTRQALREAFLTLVLERGYDAVRVSDIIARTAVNRATFYRHYRNKRDLLRSWTQDVGEVLNAGADSLEAALTQPSETLPAVVTAIFEHIALHQSYYRLMLGRHGLSVIASGLEAQVTGFLERHPTLLADLSNDVPRVLRIRAYSTQFVGIVKWWLEQDPPPSAKQIAEWTWRLEA